MDYFWPRTRCALVGLVKSDAGHAGLQMRLSGYHLDSVAKLPEFICHCQPVAFATTGAVAELFSQHSQGKRSLRLAGRKLAPHYLGDLPTTIFLEYRGDLRDDLGDGGLAIELLADDYQAANERGNENHCDQQSVHFSSPFYFWFSSLTNHYIILVKFCQYNLINYG